MYNCVILMEYRIVYIVIVVVCLISVVTVLIYSTETASTIRHTLQLRDLHHLLVPKSCEWYRIGGELGVEFNVREGLLRDGSRTNDNKLEVVLHKWMETHCSEVSWENLINILTKLKFNDIVEAVKGLRQKEQTWLVTFTMSNLFLLWPRHRM